jgi:hypothetical protein
VFVNATHWCRGGPSELEMTDELVYLFICSFIARPCPPAMLLDVSHQLHKVTYHIEGNTLSTAQTVQILSDSSNRFKRTCSAL